VAAWAATAFAVSLAVLVVLSPVASPLLAQFGATNIKGTAFSVGNAFFSARYAISLMYYFT
jgi:hypothetical protein